MEIRNKKQFERRQDKRRRVTGKKNRIEQETERMRKKIVCRCESNGSYKANANIECTINRALFILLKYTYKRIFGNSHIE